MKKSIVVIITIVAINLITYSVKAQFSLSVGINIRTAPPPLPVYTQPDCPVDGYLWCPGYWAWDDADGYYWVPGVWVMPPQPGYLWTPGYWGYANGLYGWHDGYWDTQVGFYGGVNYGCGYYGTGFYGGRWTGGHFQYNTAVVRVNRTVIRNVYVDRRVINYNSNRISYNGGAGTRARPNAREQQVMRGNHARPTAEQFRHNQNAEQDRGQFAKVNGGRPQHVSMDRPGGQFNNRVPDKRVANDRGPVNRPSVNNNRPNTPAPNNNPNTNAARPPRNNDFRDNNRKPNDNNNRQPNRFDNNRRPQANPQQNRAPMPRPQAPVQRPQNPTPRPQQQGPGQGQRPPGQGPGQGAPHPGGGGPGGGGHHH